MSEGPLVLGSAVRGGGGGQFKGVDLSPYDTGVGQI